MDREKALAALNKIIDEWPNDAEWKPVQTLCVVDGRMCFPVNAIRTVGHMKNNKEYILRDVVLQALAALTAPDAVDVEALRKEYASAECGLASAAVAKVNSYRTGWNHCLDFLAFRGLLSTADDGWQPIETAPKDGDILLYDCGVIWVGCFQKVGGQLPWFTYQFDGELQQATHWKPLPQPPKAEVKK